MSDSSRHSLYFVLESVYGETPANPNFKFLRHKGCTLALTKSTHISEETRPDRQIGDYRHGVKQVGGEIQFELSSESFDDLLEAVLCGTWAARIAPHNSSTITAASAINGFTDSTNSLPVWDVGDKIAITGFTNPANNVTGVVVVSTVGELRLSSGTVVNEAEGPAITFTNLTRILRAGIARRSFTILRHFTDLQSSEKPFHIFRGCEFNNLKLDIKADGLITGSFSIVGKTQELSQTGVSGQTLLTPNSKRIMDSFSGSLLEGGVESGIVTEANFTLENSIEPRFGVGSDVAVRNGSIGRSNASGQATFYFQDSAMIEKFINEEDSSLQITVADKSGARLRFTFPTVVYNGGQPDTQSQGDIMLTMPFQAIYNTTDLTNIMVESFPN